MRENIVENIDFGEALAKRYISYAMSTIMSRSLPDVRDGLKPVHRRLLYAMLKLRLDPEHGFKKCARVVGDVIGKFHPHGDQAVYDALVRLAQIFAVRYPLVEGQGNFGSLDGDRAAAMRYTEAKLTKVAMYLLQDIDKDTVDFKATYDDSDNEPVVLPAKFPNLLANGSEGIAVGMATNIPPHNISEIFSALIHLMNNPDCEVKSLVRHIAGPDFPTGGIVMESKEQIIKAYETGRGSFRLRAKWEREDLSHGQYQIIVKEIPYQIQKAKLIEKIVDLFKAKKLSLLGSIRDESDSELRLVIEPKSKLVNQEMLMDQLFKFTDLEIKFHLNLNVLDSNLVPRVLNLKEVLEECSKHRYEILTRKSTYELNKITDRLEILAGLLIAYLNLDEVIKIIREEDDAKGELIKRFSLSDVQAEAILNMRLRSLRKLEEIKIKEESEELTKRKAYLEKLLASKDLQSKALLEEFEELRKEFSPKVKEYKRRTEIIHESVVTNFNEADFIEKKPVTVIVSKLGWLKISNGHNIDASKVKYRSGDKERFLIEAKTTDKLLVASSEGKFYTVDIHKFLNSDEQQLNFIFELGSKVNIINIFLYNENSKFILATKFAKGFVVEAKEIISQTKLGKQIVTLASNDELKAVSEIEEGHNLVAVANSNRKILMFPLAELPVMTKGKGVILQKQISSDLTDIVSLNSEEGLYFKSSKNRHEKDIRSWVGKRASKGALAPHGFARNNKFR